MIEERFCCVVLACLFVCLFVCACVAMSVCSHLFIVCCSLGDKALISVFHFVSFNYFAFVIFSSRFRCKRSTNEPITLSNIYFSFFYHLPHHTLALHCPGPFGSHTHIHRVRIKNELQNSWALGITQGLDLYCYCSGACSSAFVHAEWVLSQCSANVCIRAEYIERDDGDSHSSFSCFVFISRQSDDINIRKI